MGEVGDEKDIFRSPDEAQVLVWRLDGRGLEGRDGTCQEVAEVRVGGLHPQQSVQVRGAEIGVDQDDLTVEGGEVEAEIRGDKALARAALAAAYSPDPFIHTSLLNLGPTLIFITDAG